MKNDVTEQIQLLKKEKNAVILAHYYCDDAVQQIADLLDDFRKNGKNIRKDEFSELLYETFESYKKQEKWC